VFVFEGGLAIGGRKVARNELGALSAGERVELVADAGPARALLVAGRPLREPVAKYGPFVMNTQVEIFQAVADLRAGKF
jgi:redox-sensitive bicupin YhaK (pirin superfamily)